MIFKLIIKFIENDIVMQYQKQANLINQLVPVAQIVEDPNEITDPIKKGFYYAPSYILFTGYDAIGKYEQLVNFSHQIRGWPETLTLKDSSEN